jgi:hypothetical protein
MEIKPSRQEKFYLLVTVQPLFYLALKNLVLWAKSETIGFTGK